MADNRRFRYGDQWMTKDEAKRLSPNPMFFQRPDSAMTKRELEEMLLRNIQEIRIWLNTWEKVARGQVNGRVTKESLRHDINRLHDWRAGMDIMSGALGRPYLWEE